MDPPIEPKRRAARYISIAALTLFAGILVVTWLDDLGGGGSERDRIVPDPLTVAVMPFEIDSDQEIEAFLIDGLHDDLIHRIGGISSIRAISRNSVMGFRGANANLRRVAWALGVAYVVESGLQISGDDIRVDVSLFDAPGERRLWTRSFEQELTAANLFRIQAEIGASIARTMDVTLTSDEQRRLDAVPTENLHAYEAYLMGRQQLRSRNTSSLSVAVDYLHEAVQLDPKFAEAYASLARAYGLLLMYSGPTGGEDLSVKAKLALERAFELDDGIARAWLARALEQGGVGPRADSACTRALGLAPSDPEIIQQCARVLRISPAKRAVMFEKAYRLDPLSPAANWYFANALQQAGRVEEAIERLERTVEFAPGFPNAYWGIGDVYYFARGEADDAYRWYARAAELDAANADAPARLGLLLTDLGELDEAERWTGKALELDPAMWLTNLAAQQLEIRRGNLERASQHSIDALRERPALWTSLNLLRTLDLQAGNPALAVQRYRGPLPELFAGAEPAIDQQNLMAAVDAALALERNGQHELAESLLTRGLEVMDDMQRAGSDGYGFSDVKAYALLNRPEDAMVALEQAIDADFWVGWYQLETDPAFESLHGERRFRSLLGELEEIVADQRDRVRAVEPAAAMEDGD